MLDEIPAGDFEYSYNMMDRDLSALVKMDILTYHFGGYQPNLELVDGLYGNSGVEVQ